MILEELLKSVGDDSEIEGMSDDDVEESTIVNLTNSLRQDPLGHLFQLLNNNEEDLEGEDQVDLLEEEMNFNENEELTDLYEEVVQEEMEIDDQNNSVDSNIDQTSNNEKQLHHNSSIKNKNKNVNKKVGSE
ncbi:hypothetical protein J6590_033140 [Homalodisca vitripennis]|nr:hypothetical protein J6590_033140 [Homalodisca vitripennis]